MKELENKSLVFNLLNRFNSNTPDLSRCFRHIILFSYSMQASRREEEEEEEEKE